MKIKIKKIDGNFPVNNVRMIIFGAPKIGKSTFASGFPNPLFIATEKGYQALKIHVVDINDWNEFKAVVEYLTKQDHSFKTIVIDTVDILFKYCVFNVCDDLNIEHPSDESWGKGYDIISNEFLKVINKLFLSDLSIILISHTRVEEFWSRGGKFTRTVLSIPNQCKRLILPLVDIVGLIKTKTVRINENDYDEVRVITFHPSEFEEAGDRTGKMPKEIILDKDPKISYKRFSEYFYKNDGG